jgi:hypothetical protein
LACHIAELFPNPYLDQVNIEEKLDDLIKNKKSPGSFHFDRDILIDSMSISKDDKDVALKIVHKKFVSKKMNEIFEMETLNKSKISKSLFLESKSFLDSDQLSQEIDKFILSCISSVNDDTEYSSQLQGSNEVEKTVPGNILLDSLDKLDVVQICDLIQSTKPLSDVKSTAHSNYSCNETSYISIRVEIKFGFIRLHEK